MTTFTFTFTCIRSVKTVRLSHQPYGIMVATNDGTNDATNDGIIGQTTFSGALAGYRDPALDTKFDLDTAGNNPNFQQLAT